MIKQILPEDTQNLRESWPYIYDFIFYLKKKKIQSETKEVDVNDDLDHHNKDNSDDSRFS